MCKGFNGLGDLVRKSHDVFEGDLFVFIGMSRDRCKILFWERGGFVLDYKRLERGRFQLPRGSSSEVEMTSTELSMLLDGIDFSRVKKSKPWLPPKKSELRSRKGDRQGELSLI